MRLHLGGPVNFRIAFTLSGDDMATLVAVSPAWSPDTRMSKAALRRLIIDQAARLGTSPEFYWEETEQLWGRDEWDERYSVARPLIRKLFGE